RRRRTARAPRRLRHARAGTMARPQPPVASVRARRDRRRRRVRSARRPRAAAAPDDPRGRLRVALATRLRAAPLAAPARAAALRCARRAAARLRQVKLALAHEYFVTHGGAERVIEALHQMWPDLPVYTFFHD